MKTWLESARRRLAGTLRLSACCALALLSSCSLTVQSRTACEAVAPCRAAFGFGAVCGADGYCRAPQLHARCTSSFPADLREDPMAYADALVVGSIYRSPDDDGAILATELAIRQAAGSGGLSGRALAILHCDTAPSTADALSPDEAAAELATFLADTGVHVIVGPRASSRAEAAYRALEGRDVVLVSPSATSPSLTQLDGLVHDDDSPGLLWRTIPPDDLQGQVIASDVADRGAVRVSILYQRGAYGDGLFEIVAAELAARGVMTEPFPYEGRRYVDVVASIGASAADEVLFISSEVADVLGFLAAASATPTLIAQYQSKGIFFTDTVAAPRSFEGAVPTAIELFPQVRGTRPSTGVGTTIHDTFSGAYAVEFMSTPAGSPYAAQSYDAGWIVLYGLAWADAREADLGGRSVARGLRRLSAGPSIDVLATSWSPVRESFEAGQSVNLRGVSGALDFDPVTEETRSAIELWALAPDGMGGHDFVVVDRVEP